MNLPLDFTFHYAIMFYNCEKTIIKEKQKKRGAGNGVSSTRRKKSRHISFRWISYVVLLALILASVVKVKQFALAKETPQVRAAIEAPEYDVELLTVNEYSRPGIALDHVNGIVIHYTANPGSTAMQNRDYFEGLKDSHITKASSHFIVGLEGEIVQCIPTSEIAYASNSRNSDTIAIECCHESEDGKFNQKTYDSLVHLTAWLCQKFNLTAEDVIRHYDVTGKKCPLYFVEHEDAWEQFRQDVADYSK